MHQNSVVFENFTLSLLCDWQFKRDCDNMKEVLFSTPSRTRRYKFILVVLMLVKTIITISECKLLIKHEKYARSIQRYSFNDPEFSNQYYLADDLMNIRKTWNTGIDGNGITICINDPTGVNFNHPDLKNKFVSHASFNFRTNGSDVSPRPGQYAGDVAHGTMMAGLAAATANNAVCGVGVAYNAKLSCILNDEDSEWDFHIAVAKSLEYRNDINDIYSNSWGLILQKQNNIAYVHPFVKEAIRRTAEKGRHGKGSIIVFSSGNGGLFNGTCSYDELTSSIYTIVISVITGRNTMSMQNVKCTGITAVTYGRDGLDGVDNPNFQMPSPGLDNKCIKRASASSASTAVASGIFALVLQANKNITWRDVQHLVIRSSSSNFESVTWITNGAGLKVNDGFGFGVLDAKALTENAKIWKNVASQLFCSVQFNENTRLHGVTTFAKQIDISNALSCQNIRYLEHVVVVVTLNFTLRRKIQATLTSPFGTKSIMLRSGRILDDGQHIDNLSVLSLHHWGENPNGVWTFDVRNVEPDAGLKGFLFNFELQFFGTYEDPMLGNKNIKQSQIGANSTASTTKRPPTTQAMTVSKSSRTRRSTTTSVLTKRLVSSHNRTVFTTTPTRLRKNNNTKNNREITIAIAVSVCIVVFILLVVLSLKYKKRSRPTQEVNNEHALT